MPCKAHKLQGAEGLAHMLSGRIGRQAMQSKGRRYLKDDRPAASSQRLTLSGRLKAALTAFVLSGRDSESAHARRCPHRLAPMSEGRIEPSDGTLMCSYHGWRFRGDGACVDIPQSLNAKANAAACSSSRACIKAHPVKVKPCYEPSSI